jgi:hypothetical protein
VPSVNDPDSQPASAPPRVPAPGTQSSRPLRDVVPDGVPPVMSFHCSVVAYTPTLATPAVVRSETMPWSRATFIASPDEPCCQVLDVSTSSHHGYALTAVGTETGGDCPLMAAAAALTQETSWAASCCPYSQAHALEFAPAMLEPVLVITIVVVHAPYGVFPDDGQSVIRLPSTTSPGSEVFA